MTGLGGGAPAMAEEATGTETARRVVIRAVGLMLIAGFVSSLMHLGVRVVSPDLPTMMIDAARIKYVLTSLLSNAMKYSDQGSAVMLDVDRRGAGVVFHVSDHGIGIPADEQARIFEPFYRARNVGAVGGTGLGLSIVKDIVDAHHGTMRIDSEVDRGTRISVYLPQG